MPPALAYRMPPSSNDFVLQALEGQEERLQRLENGYTQTAAALSAGEKQFQMISSQISELGDKVTQSIADLGGRVDGLAKQTAEHREYLQTLNKEKDERDQRKKLARRIVVGVCSAIGIGALGAWGQDLWGWLREAIRHLAQ